MSATGVRECFRARDGYVYGVCDFSTLELCTLAQVCLELFGWSDLAEALKAGQDLHIALAADILQRPYDDALAAYKAGDKIVANVRQAAKCFHPDTEALTYNGWVRIGELTSDDVVAQAAPVAGRIEVSWTKPTALQTLDSPGTLMHLRNEGMDLRVTPDHRMLAFNALGLPVVTTPGEFNKKRGWWNAGLCAAGDWAPDERILKLAIATQADGSFKDNQIILGFSKQRKIDRLRMLLRDGEYAVRYNSKYNVTTFTLRADLSWQIKELLTVDKQFTWRWLHLTPELRTVALDEAEFWDSHRGPRSNAYGYTTAHKHNADVLQAVAAITGRKTRLVKELDRSNPEHSPIHKLTVRRGDRSRGEGLDIVEAPYAGEVVCLSVPSSFVIVRDGGVVTIVGQCANFGFPGGMGPGRFVVTKRREGLKLCLLGRRAEVCGVEKVREYKGRALPPTCKACLLFADELRLAWFAKWREMKDYFALVGRETEGPSGGEIITRGGFVRNGCGFSDGANHRFQSLAARGAKHAFWLVCKEAHTDPKSPLWGSHPMAFIHDEFIIEAPEAKAPEAVERMSAIMVAGMKTFCPDVPIKAEPTLMKYWSKAAKPVRGPDGRLKVWVPDREHSEPKYETSRSKIPIGNVDESVHEANSSV